MGKLFAIVLMVGAVYVGLTYYTDGMEPPELEARSVESVTRSARTAPVTERVRRSVTESLDKGARRYDKY